MFPVNQSKVTVFFSFTEYNDLYSLENTKQVLCISQEEIMKCWYGEKQSYWVSTRYSTSLPGKAHMCTQVWGGRERHTLTEEGSFTVYFRNVLTVLLLPFKMYFLVTFIAFLLNITTTYCGRKLADKGQLASQKVHCKAVGKLCLDHRVANNSVQHLFPDLQLNSLNQMLLVLQLQNITKQCSLSLPASKCRTNKIIP